MVPPITDVCVGPLDPVCQAVGGVAGSVGSAASDAVLGGLGSAFVQAAQQVSGLALGALDATTSVDLTAAWFRQNVAVIASITLPVVVGLFALQVIASVLRREPGGLVRAVTGIGKALLGAALAIAVTQTALIAADQICQYVATAAGTTVAGAAQRFFDLTWLAGPQGGPVLQILLGFAMTVGLLLMWAVLLFRKASLMLVAVFAPIAFAGLVWDHTRVWTRRWIEVVAALVLCKVVIVTVFVVGASAFSGVGPGSGGTADPGALTAASLSDLLVGLLLLSIAIFAPWLTWRFVHWSGMEAAAVMHGTVMASPVPSVARTSGSQAKFMAQSAVSTMLLGGAGAAGSAARSGVGRGTAGGAGGAGTGPSATPKTGGATATMLRPQEPRNDRGSS